MAASMAPPQRSVKEGQAAFRAVHVPLSTPFAFTSPSVLCYPVGSNLCLHSLEDGRTRYIPTPVYSISRLCADPAGALVAFCESGTSPRVSVYNTEDPPRLLYNLSDVAELELADLAFSQCGSRLYTLSLATSRRLCVFCTENGERLKGCSLDLPARFDKLAVFPGHKDQLALVRNSAVRVVTFKKSFETYISKLHPAVLPSDVEITVCAYTWTPTGHFMFATRAGALVTLDGSNGSLVHVCQAATPITGIAVTLHYVMTAHVGNSLSFWRHDPAQAPEPQELQGDWLSKLPQMSSKAGLGGVFELEYTLELGPPTSNTTSTEEIRVRQQWRKKSLFGQVSFLQVTPDCRGALLTTAEGEVWSCRLPYLAAEESQAMELNVHATTDDLRLKLLTWFHTHHICDMALVGGSKAEACASIDEGGRLRLWSYGQTSDAKGFRVMCFTSALTSMTTDYSGKVLVVGSSSGCVHCISCADWTKPALLDTLRLGDSGIAKVCSVTHDAGYMSIAALLFDHRIAFLAVNMSDSKLRMFGFVHVAGMVTDICYHDQEFKRETLTPARLAAVGASRTGPWNCLWMIRAPTLDYDPMAVDLNTQVCSVMSAKLSASLTLDNGPTTVASVSKRSLAIGFANGEICVYPPAATEGLPTVQMPVHPPSFENRASHGQLVTCLRTSRDGGWLVSGSMDGSVYLSRTSSDGSGKEFQKVLHNPYNGGVAQAVVSNSSKTPVLLSTGGTDGILAWTAQDPDFVKQRDPSLQSVSGSANVEDDTDEGINLDVDESDTRAFPIWAPISNEERALKSQGEAADPELNAVAMVQRLAFVNMVDVLRKKLRVLIDQNNTCPDLEKLDRGEFCVDFERRDEINATTQEKCDQLRYQLEQENLARQLVRDRLVKEFWDPMRGKGCQICSLKSKLAVSNYPERAVPEHEQATRRKLQTMRRMEHLETNMLQEPTCPQALRSDAVLQMDAFTTGKESYVVNWWRAQPEPETPETAAVTALLYDPFELLTSSRRRLQVQLLQSLAAEYRTNFNQLFKTCQQTKQGVMDQIKEKIARMTVIRGELGESESIPPDPVLKPTEDAQSVLTVADSEIQVERWISPEELQRIADEQAREEERLRKLRENDAGARALQQMMGGNLKTKKDLSALEITLEPELWMLEIPEEEMTDVQRQALKEFREKEVALKEEQDKYRKQLEADLKKLKAEVDELMSQFEVTLEDLSRKRFGHDAKFFCQELYCARLHLALLQTVEDNLVLQRCSRDVTAEHAKLSELEARLDEFRAEVNDAREEQDDRHRVEKEASSAQQFRQQFSQSGLEPEIITALLQVFRAKKPGVGATGTIPRASIAAGTMGNLVGQTPEPKLGGTGLSLDAFRGLVPRDAYPDLGTEAAAAAAAAAQTLPEDDAVPETIEGADEASIQRMRELRREKLLAELDVRSGQAVIQEMDGLLAHKQQERDAARAAADRLQAELADHERLMDRELHDIEMLFRSRQGQVEVPQAAVVTDFSDAIVIDQDVVESRNARILELGKEKVKSMETVKEFRRKLSRIQWEHRMLGLQTTDLEERTKDVHMLRVTKGLQSLLQGGEEGRNRADAELLEKKVEHLRKTSEQKEASLKKQHAMTVHNSQQRKLENQMLGRKLHELQQNVIQREHIRRLQAPQGRGTVVPSSKEGKRPQVVGGGGRVEENEATIRAAQSAFRETRGRQALLDHTRKLTEEIEVLRRELDRLRQRTFPTFVQLHEEKPLYGDHRMR